MLSQELKRITTDDLQKLPEASLKHIEALEESMENHYEVWTSVYPQLALAVDPITKARTEQQLKEIIADMKKDFEEILRFLHEGGYELVDPYPHIRNIIEKDQPNRTDSLLSTYVGDADPPARPKNKVRGRDTLINDWVEKLVKPEDARLRQHFAIEGEPGVGKTTLAIMLAHDSRVKDHFENNVFWVSMERNPDIIRLLKPWAERLKVETSKVT